MVFKDIRGSWFATTATCVVAVQASSPSKIIPRISRARAAAALFAVQHDLLPEERAAVIATP